MVVFRTKASVEEISFMQKGEKGRWNDQSAIFLSLAACTTLGHGIKGYWESRQETSMASMPQALSLSKCSVEKSSTDSAVFLFLSILSFINSKSPFSALIFIQERSPHRRSYRKTLPSAHSTCFRRMEYVSSSRDAGGKISYFRKAAIKSSGLSDSLPADNVVSI